jgi:hypothetical protein
MARKGGRQLTNNVIRTIGEKAKRKKKGEFAGQTMASCFRMNPESINAVWIWLLAKGEKKKARTTRKDKEETVSSRSPCLH